MLRAHLHFQKSTSSDYFILWSKINIESLIVVDVSPLPQSGKRGLFALRNIIKSIVLRLVCRFPEFSLLSASIKYASFCLCFWRKASSLKSTSLWRHLKKRVWAFFEIRDAGEFISQTFSGVELSFLKFQGGGGHRTGKP